MRGFCIGYIITSLLIHLLVGSKYTLIPALPSFFMVLYLIKSRKKNREE